MESVEFPTTAAQVGALFGADVLGDPQAPISRLSALSRAGEGSLSFLGSAQFSDLLKCARGSVVFTRPEWVREDVGVTYLVVADPKASFAEVASRFRTGAAWEGMKSDASLVSDSAEIHPTARVAPGCFIGAGAKIGARTVVFPFAYIGAQVQIGEDCEVHPQAVLYDGVRLANRVKVFSGAVVGSAGFGYFRTGDTGPYTEMPQVGSVVVEDDVRVGANATIDRATLEETRIRRGTKLDDHVHIGHNAEIGEDNILCAFAVIGGSAVLEKDVVLGGQTGIGQGVTVGHGARLAGQAGSTTNVPRGLETYFFNPLIPIREFTRIYRVMRKLPKLLERVRELEKHLGEKKNA